MGKDTNLFSNLQIINAENDLSHWYLFFQSPEASWAGSYLGKIAGSVATAGYQKDQIDKLNKKSKEK